MLTFRLSNRSGVPTYVQLEQQVRQAVRMGLLREGDQLPTAKEVVQALAINPNTVLKAYRELERDGVVAPRQGLGTFVTGTFRAVDPAIFGRYRRQLTRWMRSAREAGLNDEDLSALFESELGNTAGEHSA